MTSDLQEIHAGAWGYLSKAANESGNPIRYLSLSTVVDGVRTHIPVARREYLSVRSSRFLAAKRAVARFLPHPATHGLIVHVFID